MIRDMGVERKHVSYEGPKRSSLLRQTVKTCDAVELLGICICRRAQVIPNNAGQALTHSGTSCYSVFYEYREVLSLLSTPYLCFILTLPIEAFAATRLVG